MDGRIAALRQSIESKNEELLKLEDPEAIKKLGEQLVLDDAQLAQLLEVQGMKATALKRQEDFKTPVGAVPFSGAQPESSGDRRAIERSTKTLGELFLDTPDVKAFMERKLGHSKVQFGSSPAFHTEHGLKALVTGAGATSGGAFINEDRRPIFDPGTFYQELRLTDLVTRLDTTSPTIEYVRQGAHTNAAASVAEATATTGSSGEKPESTMVFERVSEAMSTIAHWMAATRQVLDDAPQIRGIIDNFLRYGLREELEAQIISGNSVGDDLTGVLNQAGTTAQAFDTDVLTTLRKAKTKVRMTGRATPTAYVMNPEDWQAVDLLKDNEGRYYYGGPAVVGQPRIWGLPVVEVENMPVGTAVVADWRLAVLWDRMQTQIFVSDSHDNFFTRNLIAILAEMRCGFGLIRPAAFVEIDLTA